MPAYQSVPEFDLSEKYHLKAVGCEKCAERASDRITEQEWQELAAQWHSMADQAAKMLSDESELVFSAPRDRQLVQGRR